ncbi:hypothetical protein MASR2M15_25430 [Anaerolineales bacterium]
MTLPSFYDRSKVGQYYEPDFQRAFLAGTQSQAAIERTSALEKVSAHSESPSTKTLLWLIDIQIDFVFPNGRLAVANAVSDTQRLIEWIYRNTASISQISASLDTHTPYQIFHPAWWVDQNGQHPAPFTPISAEQVLKQEWQALYDPEWSLNYVQQLEQDGKKQLMIWPLHCLQGTTGAALVPALSEAIAYHAGARRVDPHYQVKGTTPQSEFYSVLEPEVPFEEGHSLNRDYLAFIASHDRIYIAGQARSHCVLETLGTYIRSFQDQPQQIQKLHLLDDCSSCIAGYEETTASQLAAYVEQGLQLVSSEMTLL